MAQQNLLNIAQELSNYDQPSEIKFKFVDSAAKSSTTSLYQLGHILTIPLTCYADIEELGKMKKESVRSNSAL